MKKTFMFWRTVLFPIGLLLMPCKVMDRDKYVKYGRGQVIISNHLSWMDIAYHVFKIPGYKRILSKKENSKNGIVRWFLDSIGVMLVDREKPALSTVRECIDTLKNGDNLLIYPEGTRNRENREIMEMHSGASMFALKSAATVVPIVVHHKGKLCRRNYIGVGDPIDLSDLYGKRLDEATLIEATERFRHGMQVTLDKLDKWVEEKGYKRERRLVRERKREKKRMQKLLNEQYKKAKRDHAANTHSK